LYSEAERVALDFSLAAASVPNAVDDEIVEITGVISLFGFMNGWSTGKHV
jgi:hypothetical protein